MFTKIRTYIDKISGVKFLSISYLFYLSCFSIVYIIPNSSLFIQLFINPFLLFSLIFLTILQYLDCRTTRIGLRKYGARERNPLFKEMNIEGVPNILFVVKMVIPFIYIYCFLILSIDVLTLSCLILAQIAYFIVILSNYHQINKKKKIFREFYESIPR